MAVTAFATRNRKEILRDPLSIVFGIGFPLVILILLSFLQKSLPGMSDIFAIENFVPGIAVFGLTFISLFSGMLISGDRSSSYLMRLFTSPLSGIDYIIGYSYPLLPMAILQSAICFLTGVILGMPVSVNILFSIVALIPVAVLFISIGLMMGSVLSPKQMNGEYEIDIKLLKDGTEEESAAANFMKEYAKLVVEDGKKFLTFYVPKEYEEMMEFSKFEVENVEPIIEEGEDDYLYTFQLESLGTKLSSVITYEVPAMGLVHENVKMDIALFGLDNLPKAENDENNENDENGNGEGEGEGKNDDENGDTNVDTEDETNGDTNDNDNGEPVAGDDQEDNPQTGNSSNMGLYISLLVAAVAIAGIVVFARKRSVQ